MRIEARAKINWTLDITGRRADGYHLMDMLMQPVTLHDDLFIDPAAELSFSVEGGPDIPAGPDNLVWRAAEALRARTGCREGAAIRLKKRIPSGAGLGGGSADAAAALLGLDRLWGLGLGQEELERVGLALGADVPFCLRGGLARVRGIGEELTPLGAGPVWPLVVVQPCQGLSTGEVFRAWHREERHETVAADKVLAAFRADDPRLMPRRPGNVLEAVSRAMRPGIREAVDALMETGAAAAQMSGSGSAVFAVYPVAAEADAALASVSRRWPGAVRCETCRESVVFDPA